MTSLPPVTGDAAGAGGWASILCRAHPVGCAEGEYDGAGPNRRGIDHCHRILNAHGDPGFARATSDSGYYLSGLITGL